jgi:hypothetical protein
VRPCIANNWESIGREFNLERLLIGPVNHLGWLFDVDERPGEREMIVVEESLP